VGYQSTKVDAAGDMANGVISFSFQTSIVIKCNPYPAYWIPYETGKWYTARLRIFSPDSNNNHTVTLLNYNNEVTPTSHIDLSAYMLFGIPTVWTWMESAAYTHDTGLGYHKLNSKPKAWNCVPG